MQEEGFDHQQNSFGHQARAKRRPLKSQLPVAPSAGQSYISCFQQALQSMND